jgi:hypothetical protein
MAGDAPRHPSMRAGRSRTVGTTRALPGGARRRQRQGKEDRTWVGDELGFTPSLAGSDRAKRFS